MQNEGFTEVPQKKNSMMQQRNNGQYRNYRPQVQRHEYRKKDMGNGKGKEKVNEEVNSRKDTEVFRNGGSNTNKNETSRSTKNSGDKNVNRFDALNKRNEDDTEEVMEGLNEMAQTMTNDNVIGLSTNILN